MLIKSFLFNFIFLFSKTLPVISKVSVAIPSLTQAIYSLYFDERISFNLVYLFKQITKTPVANGSKVPLCPTFFV